MKRRSSEAVVHTQTPRKPRAKTGERGRDLILAHMRKVLDARREALPRPLGARAADQRADMAGAGERRPAPGGARPARRRRRDRRRPPSRTTASATPSSISSSLTSTMSSTLRADDLEDALVGAPAGHGRHPRGDLGERDDVAGVEARLQRRRAGRLDADDLHRRAAARGSRSRGPEISPPPPIATRIASMSGRSSRISRPSVPCPATTSGSAKGWK